MRQILEKKPIALSTGEIKQIVERLRNLEEELIAKKINDPKNHPDYQKAFAESVAAVSKSEKLDFSLFSYYYDSKSCRIVAELLCCRPLENAVTLHICQNWYLTDHLRKNKKLLSAPKLEVLILLRTLNAIGMPKHFSMLPNLRILNLDYDNLNDREYYDGVNHFTELLEFVEKSPSPLERLRVNFNGLINAESFFKAKKLENKLKKTADPCHLQICLGLNGFVSGRDPCFQLSLSDIDSSYYASDPAYYRKLNELNLLPTVLNAIVFDYLPVFQYMPKYFEAPHELTKGDNWPLDTYSEDDPKFLLPVQTIKLSLPFLYRDNAEFYQQELSVTLDEIKNDPKRRAQPSYTLTLIPDEGESDKCRLIFSAPLQLDPDQWFLMFDEEILINVNKKFLAFIARLTETPVTNFFMLSRHETGYTALVSFTQQKAAEFFVQSLSHENIKERLGITLLEFEATNGLTIRYDVKIRLDEHCYGHYVRYSLDPSYLNKLIAELKAYFASRIHVHYTDVLKCEQRDDKTGEFLPHLETEFPDDQVILKAAARVFFNKHLNDENYLELDCLQAALLANPKALDLLPYFKLNKLSDSNPSPLTQADLNAFNRVTLLTWKKGSCGYVATLPDVPAITLLLFDALCDVFDLAGIEFLKFPIRESKHVEITSNLTAGKIKALVSSEKAIQRYIAECFVPRILSFASDRNWKFMAIEEVKPVLMIQAETDFDSKLFEKLQAVFKSYKLGDDGSQICYQEHRPFISLFISLEKLAEFLKHIVIISKFINSDQKQFMLDKKSDRQTSQLSSSRHLGKRKKPTNSSSPEFFATRVFDHESSSRPDFSF